MDARLFNLRKDIVDWADKVIPDRTPADAITKLSIEEVPELWRALKETGKLDPDELADIGIIWLDLCEMAGVHPIEIMETKMLINYRRNWKVTDGILQHENELAELAADKR